MRRWLAIGALALAAALSTAPAAASARAAQQRPLSDVLERVGFDQRLGERLPLDARFTDEHGRSITLSEAFDGRPVVLAFVYYECPMLCTLVLNGLVRALRAVELAPGRDFHVVAIGIDPAETPELARAKKARYQLEHGAELVGDWRFLTGDEQEIARVASAAGFRYAYVPEQDEYAHASGLVVATPDGRLARYFFGVEYPPRDLRLALVEASGGKVGTLVDQVLLLCYHWDPLTGRYGLAIMTLIRALGTATVLGLGVFVVRSLARERSRARACAPGPGSTGAGGA